MAVGHGIYKYSIPVDTSNPEDEENMDDAIKDYRPQRAAFLEYHRRFERQISVRHEHRDQQLQVSHYDYIIINSFRILKDPQLNTWGLRLVGRTDWGLTLTAQIVDDKRFELFMAGILKYAQDNSIVHEVPDKYKALTQINRFLLLHGNEDVKRVAENASYVRNELSEIKSAKKSSLHIKSDLDTWSDDPLPSYIRKFFSNSQKKSFLLNYNDIVNTEGIITLAFRCVTRPRYDAMPIRFAYTIKLELADNKLRDGGFVLYDKIEEINQTEALGDVLTDVDIEL